jgi:predicted ATPase
VQGKRFLHSIQIKNLLSYGSEGVELELEPLNVLIGSNASGKSNLVEAISLLAAAPRDLLKPIREGGGVLEWLWKGSEEVPEATLKSRLVLRNSDEPLRYFLAFTAEGARFRIANEWINEDTDPKRVYSFRKGKALIRIYHRLEDGVGFEFRGMDQVSPEQSILSQARGEAYPEITYISSQFERFAFFRDLSLGRATVLRRPQDVTLPGDFLLEDGSNLALVLNDLQHRPVTKRLLLEKLRLFYEGVEDLTTKVQGGTIQVFFHERGLRAPVPSARLSDGTLRYLCLLAILCHPEPPPLICLEEPELGLHPDILPAVAEMLVDAAQRTQLIVTTHSETLVSALSETPEAIVVCDRGEEGTRLRRLDPDKLKEWLDEYKLGEVWRMGEIGGNRW